MASRCLSSTVPTGGEWSVHAGADEQHLIYLTLHTLFCLREKKPMILFESVYLKVLKIIRGWREMEGGR